MQNRMMYSRACSRSRRKRKKCCSPAKISKFRLQIIQDSSTYLGYASSSFI